jgi:hypothetical protein
VETVKMSLSTQFLHIGRAEIFLHSFLRLSNRCARTINFYSLIINSHCLLNRRLSGPQILSAQYEEDKNSLSLLKSKAKASSL